MATIFIISLVVAFASLLTLSTPLANNDNNQAIMAEVPILKPSSSPLGSPSPLGIKISRVYGKDGSFQVNFTTGDSPSVHIVRIDTDSDLMWTTESCSNAAPKLPCSGALCKAATTICNHKTNACMYEYEYSDDLMVQVELHTDTFTFPGNNVKVPDLVFGCSVPIKHQVAGGLGLGRGPLSFVSQLNATLFGYCLPPYDHSEKTGFLLVGGESPVLKSHTKGKNKLIITTRLVTSPSQNPSAYYVNLTAISVGRVKLDIDISEFAIDIKNGSGGVVVDTGSTMTYLKKSVYVKVTDAIQNQIKVTTIDASPEINLPFCFTVTSKDFVFPRITFHFEKNKNLMFTLGNSYREYTHDKSTNTNISCLAMAPAPTSDHGKSSLGNIQQQNTLVVFDRVKQTVTFQPEVDCDKI